MNNIGPVLKQAREKKAVTYEDIHAKIKIHPRVLQLLEEEKFDKLPSPMFVKGFLRSYADFLELNTEELLQSYEKSKGTTVEPPQVLYIKSVDSSGNSKIPLSWWAAGVIGALVVGLVLFSHPQKLIAHLLPKASKVVKKESKEKIGNLKEAAPLPSALKESEWLSRAEQGNFPNIPAKQALELEVKALDAVWIHITADGKVIYQGILKKGTSDFWKAKSSIEIWTGNAANMALILNKNPLGSPGKGVVKKMIISHEGIRISSPLAE